ncbi:MAG: HD domain-containing protein [Paludibacteraceae bacterium]|nr:HD domain-containing protein [Paludibacteraceae bacterium]
MTNELNDLFANCELLPQEVEELSRLLATGNELVQKAIDIVKIIQQEVDLGKMPKVGLVLYEAIKAELTTMASVEDLFGEQVAGFVQSLLRVGELYRNHPDVQSDAFRKLLLTMAEDIRVVIVLICSHLYLIRKIDSYEESERMRIATEASFLYAPLAHRLGLYKVKSELEDLSLKQTNRTIYDEIVTKLHDTKQQRDAYIKAFIEPVQRKLEAAGFQFTMKGRTKSVYSIWNKIKKQNTVFENIYDIFAIRIILDTPYEKEKADCWQAYSIVTDMYQPNPKRLRDWLSIPKSNGYESLHTTVMGPEGKWVEVQIRTQRMDEIAEKGLAAHFKYKGVKSESNFDDWLANVRDLLHNPSAGMEYLDDFKLNLYDKEVFVFTPSGELKQMPKGATLLDFAFMIHSNLGSKCIGGRVNGKNVPIRYQLNNGDQVEIQTASNQTPHEEWLEFVQTTKARTRIKQYVREQENAYMDLGKELLKRRLKNWKLEYEEGVAGKLAKKMGSPTIQDFYKRLAEDSVDLAKVKDAYIACMAPETKPDEVRSADGFEHVSSLSDSNVKEDVLVIDNNLQGIQYNLSKCCNPIYGDDIFGFVSVKGGIRIHKKDCPNAPQMLARFGYRFIKARWAGKSGSQYNCTLRVIGTDDIGIVTNISSLIQKESNVSLRSMSVDSCDGLFRGTLTISVSDTKVLDGIIKKIKAVKGVKSVDR